METHILPMRCPVDRTLNRKAKTPLPLADGPPPAASAPPPPPPPADGHFLISLIVTAGTAAAGIIALGCAAYCSMTGRPAPGHLWACAFLCFAALSAWARMPTPPERIRSDAGK